MKREKIKYLRQWRHDPIRVPLLLRGARQVGKSWLVQSFGQEFEYFIEINFEKDKRAGALFTEHIDIMFDIGIAQRMLGLDLAQWVTQPMEINYLGFMAEQLVAQEFIAYGDEHKSMQLYYWQNETKTGHAEVDFITIKNKQVVPVEVKARLKGGMKSLKVYFETHPSTKIALKISEGQFAKQDHLQEIPLYAVDYWTQR